MALSALRTSLFSNSFDFKSNLKPVKKINYLVIALCTCVWCACNFSVGTKKDLVTGLSYTYNGFSVDDVVLAGPDNARMTTNEVPLQTAVGIVIQGISNFSLKDNKAYPGIKLSVTDKDGAVVLQEEDLFEGTEGYSAEDASVLRGSLTVGDPMKAGETYQLSMHVWDKQNPENILDVTVAIVVTQ